MHGVLLIIIILFYNKPKQTVNKTIWSFKHTYEKERYRADISIDLALKNIPYIHLTVQYTWHIISQVSLTYPSHKFGRLVIEILILRNRLGQKIFNNFSYIIPCSECVYYTLSVEKQGMKIKINPV